MKYKRFTRRERDFHIARPQETRAFFVAMGHYTAMPDGTVAPIMDAAAREHIAEIAFECILAWGKPQFRKLPDPVAMAFPGAERRKVAGTDECWIGLAFDRDGRLTSSDIWLKAPEGATEAQVRSAVASRLRAILSENLRGGWPPRSPRPRLAVLNR